MPDLLIAFALASFILLLADHIIDTVLYVSKAAKSRRLRRIPAPLFRWHSLPPKGGLNKATMSLAKEFDSDVVGLYVGGEYVVSACSTNTVKEVLSNPEFSGKPHNYFTYLWTMKTNKGVTMTDGADWEEQRNFLVKQLSDLSVNKMNQTLENSLKSILKELGDGGPEIDVSTVISKSVIKVLWKILADTEMPEEKLSELATLMNKRTKAFDYSGGWLAQMPWLRHVLPEWTGYNYINKVNKKLRTLIKDEIEKQKTTYKEGVTRSFIDAFLNKMNDSKTGNTSFTDDHLMMLCLDILIGGVRTISNSLDYCFLRMIHHPEVQAKVQAELDLFLSFRFPKIEDINRLPFVNAVITECLRISSVVPVIGPRRTLRAAALGHYIVPKDTTVIMNMVSVAMDEETFPEPDKFKPERFADNETKIDDKENAHQTYSFGFGKRRCPGEVLARNYMFIILSGILHEYKLAAPHRKPVPSLEPNIGITHTPKPYRLSLEKRKRSRNNLGRPTENDTSSKIREILSAYKTNSLS